MTAHMSVEYFDEPLRAPLIKSLVLHGALLAGVAGYVLYQPSVEQFGAPDAGGAVVAISPVASIPVPTRGQRNPLANDSKSTAPQAPAEKAAPKAAPKQPEKAIPLKSDIPVKSKEAPPPSPKFRPLEPTPNQLTSKSAQALSDPLFSMSGAGRIGTGMKTTLGDRFGAYAAQVREKVARMWQTAGLGSGERAAIVTFELMRNGTVRNVVLVQKSGSVPLDVSAQRAVQAAAPFLPLPAAFERDVAFMEFEFELER